MSRKTETTMEPVTVMLPKSRTGMTGFDEITEGGLPKARPTLVTGGPGSGKTLFAMEYLVKGATEFNEPGVFIAFEETPEELAKNVRSLGFDLNELAAQKKLVLDYVRIERSEIEVTGEYDLEGLFVRIGYLADSIKAKRIAIDTLEALFASLPNEAILRAELRRLFRWLKERGLTAVITAERGTDARLTRHGLEEYVSDCVILLDHRVTEQLSTRRLRIVKYRGSFHGTNEYPFLIERDGISILPITSVELKHKVSSERVSTGIVRLDSMMGDGYFKGSSILVSGTAGTGKTSFASAFAEATCKRGGKVLYFSFEESEPQIIRNMRSIGMDLEPWVRKGLLQFHASRPSAFGLEMHLVKMHAFINEFEPDAVIMDPISNLVSVGSASEVNSMLNRIIDFMKGKGITTVLTNLSSPETTEQTEVAISSMIDTWILLRTVEMNGERNRTIYILKSRGMAHSNQVREFTIEDRGVKLTDVYVGEGQVFTGTARQAQEAKDLAEALVRKQEIERKRREYERRLKAAESESEALRAQMQQDRQELEMIVRQEELREEARALDRRRLSEIRKADEPEEEAGKDGRVLKKAS